MGQPQGSVISGRSPTGPGQTADLQIHEGSAGVNNVPAVSAMETMDQVAEIRPGTVIEVEILRNDKKMTLPVTVLEYPEENKSQ